MSDKNLRGMTAPTVLFSEFDGDPERLRFAWECCGHVVMNISDLPTTVLVRHDVSRFMLRFLRLSLQTPTTKTPPAEPTGRVAAGARFSINPAPYDRNRWRTRALPSSEESALRAASSQPSDHEVKCSRSACRHFRREVNAHGRRR